LKGALDPDGLEGTEDDDDHDFQMGLSFHRQDMNINPFKQSKQPCSSSDQSPLYQGGNIDNINIDNLFYDGNITCKLSYSNYCAVT